MRPLSGGCPCARSQNHLPVANNHTLLVTLKNRTLSPPVERFIACVKDGQGAIGNSSDSSFKEWRSGFSRRIEAGTAETKCSLMLNKLRRATDSVVTTCGIGNTAARNASMTAAPPGMSEGGEINTASARSASQLLQFQRSLGIRQTQLAGCGYLLVERRRQAPGLTPTMRVKIRVRWL
jgi:hypothetical protein